MILSRIYAKSWREAPVFITFDERLDAETEIIGHNPNDALTSFFASIVLKGSRYGSRYGPSSQQSMLKSAIVQGRVWVEIKDEDWNRYGTWHRVYDYVGTETEDDVFSLVLRCRAKSTSMKKVPLLVKCLQHLHFVKPVAQ